MVTAGGLIGEALDIRDHRHHADMTLEIAPHSEALYQESPIHMSLVGVVREDEMIGGDHQLQNRSRLYLHDHDRTLVPHPAAELDRPRGPAPRLDVDLGHEIDGVHIEAGLVEEGGGAQIAVSAGGHQHFRTPPGLAPHDHQEEEDLRRVLLALHHLRDPVDLIGVTLALDLDIAQVRDR